MRKEILEGILDHLFVQAQHIVEVQQHQHARLLISFKVDEEKKLAKQIAILPLSGDMDVDGAVIRITAKIMPEDGVAVMIDEIFVKYVLDENEKVDMADSVRVMKGSKEAIIFSFFGRDWQSTAICEIKRNPTKLLKGEILTGVSQEGHLAPHK